MKILWVCFFMLPAIAEQLGKPVANKEGWIAGLAEELAGKKGENGLETEELELSVCFAIPNNTKNGKFSEPNIQGIVKGIHYYSFHEDMVNLERYDAELEAEAKNILDQVKPDVLHIFGTEYGHGLAFARAFGKPEHTLVGLQGLMGACTEAYMAGLPEYVRRRVTFRDWLRRDSLWQQQQKFGMRATMEKKLLQTTGHVTGRTNFDKQTALAINPKVSYHFMNETLRSVFYQGIWKLATCKRHTLFVSQGNYPLKGLHQVLEVMPTLVKKYPDIKLYVAGDRITNRKTCKDRLKLSGYGKYLLELIRKGNLENRVIFLGKLDALEMKERMLKSHIFISPSSLENSSNSMGEAMLLGVPVVASQVGGLPSLMTDEQEGLFYEFGDRKALVHCISRIFDTDSLALHISEQARERAAATHAPEANKKRLLEIYGELC
ncbi:MAG: glycosyltransferase family 4 protein [Lachnospiraceae bacterium]|nr:glycosyltransferase family 4 protein [Lachnospiraceae bacterium]